MYFKKTENVTSPWVVQCSYQAVNGTKNLFCSIFFFPRGYFFFFSVSFSSLYSCFSVFSCNTYSAENL